MRDTLRRYAVGFAALGGLFAFYRSTRPLGIHVSDSYAWVNTVETESFRYFFHPHHVLYIPLAWRWSAAVRAALPGVSVWAAMSALSAAFGCAGVAAVYLTLRLLEARRGAAVAAGALQAVAFGWWFFSSEPEVYVISAACALWCLYFLVRLGISGRLGDAAWAGLAAGLAALFHQTGIFLFAPAAVVVWMLHRRGAPKYASAFAGAFALIVTPVYLAAAWAATGTLSPGAFVRWIFLFGGEGYGGLEAASLPKSAIGLSRALVGGQALLDWARGAGAGGTGVAVGALLGAAGAAAAVALATAGISVFKRQPTRVRAGAAAAFAAFCVYGLFSIYFDPANFEWWTIPLSLAGVAVSVLALTGRAPRVRLAWAVVVMVGASNYLLDFSYRRQPGADIVRNAAREIAAVTTPNDVIVLPPFLGSVLWYENRDRTIFCPAKAQRTLGAAGAAERFESLAAEAATSGARIVAAGAEIDADVATLMQRVSGAADGRAAEKVGEIIFFGRRAGFVRMVEVMPVVALDAGLVTGHPDAALVASTGASR